jgi:DNA polymerase III sliding clamp (beta) subunit (PCNA family)
MELRSIYLELNLNIQGERMNRIELLTAVEKIKPAISSGLTDQDNLIMFEGGEVKTFNNEIMMISPVDISFEGAVPANEMLSLLQKMNDKSIKISEKGSELRISGKTTKAVLQKSEVEMPEVTVPSKFTLLPINFTEGLKYCRFTVAESGNVLHNIMIEGDKIVSSDNYRITEYTLEKDVFKKTQLIPAPICTTLISFTPISFASNKSWLFFKNEEEAVLCIRRVEEKFPDIQSILKEKFKGEKVSLPENLKEALERAKILSAEDMVTGNRTVDITIDNDHILCQGECSMGRIDEEIKIEYSGKKIFFSIVPDFLYQILNNTDKMVVGESSLKFKTKNFQHIVQLIS